MIGPPSRKPTRLPDYDYSSCGAYFLTLCSKDRKHLFCRIVGDGVLDVPQAQLSFYGQAVDAQIREIGSVYRHLSIDKYVIMPNHVHLLVFVSGPGSSGTPTPTNSVIASLVSTLKRLTNRKCGADLWQRSYYDHVIRDERDYLARWQYIDGNPARWREDELYTL